MRLNKKGVEVWEAYALSTYRYRRVRLNKKRVKVWEACTEHAPVQTSEVGRKLGDDDTALAFVSHDLGLRLEQ